MMLRASILVVSVTLCCGGCAKSVRPGTRAQAAGPQPGELTFRQSTANNEATEEPLDEHRARRSFQVSVDARVISGDAALAALAVTDGVWHGAGDVQRWSAPLDPETAAALLVTAQVADGSTVLTAPRLTIFDGQRAFVVVASEIAYTAGFRRSADGRASGKFDPVSELVKPGVHFDVQAGVNADRSSTSLHLRPTIIQLEEMKDAPWPDAPPGRGDLRIQVPHTITAAVDETVTVPNDSSVLLRLARVRVPANPDAPALEPLYLLVRATIIKSAVVSGE